MTSSDGSLSSPSSSSSRCWLVSSLLEACFSSRLFEVTAQSPIRLAHFGDVEVLSPEGRHDAYSLALVGVADGVFCGRVGRFMPLRLSQLVEERVLCELLHERQKEPAVQRLRVRRRHGVGGAPVGLFA